jgi:hypothetical protein
MRALQLFPTAHALLARKRDHGRAEAALIALTIQTNSTGFPRKRDASPDGIPANVKI